MQKLSLSHETSDTIKCARVLCILFMMTVHVWPGAGRVIDAYQSLPLGYFFEIVINRLGRASVPLLSLFSGMLFAVSFSRRASVARLIRGKFLSLIVPIAFWSAPVLVLLLAGQIAVGQSDGIPTDTMGWINALTSLTSGPANGPLFFLRDIFVVSVYGTLILLAYDRSRVLGIFVLLIILILEHRGPGFVLFRNQIATFFFFGMMLAVWHRSGWSPSLSLCLGLLIVSEAARHLDPAFVDRAPHVVDVVLAHLPRVAVSFLMWYVTVRIARSASGLKNMLIAIEKHIFIIFCSHHITIKFVAFAALLLGMHETNPTYILWFLGQLPLCVLVGIALSKLLSNVPPANGWKRRRPLRA